MSNPFYTAPATPADFSAARSATIRQQWGSIDTAFDKVLGRVSHVTAAGTANALTVTMTAPPASYEAGLILHVKIATTNTGPATINVNGLGAVSILTRNGSALIAGDLIAGSVETMSYTSGAFRIREVAPQIVPNLNRIILRPEDFGDVGLQSVDQNAAFEAMMVVARSVGKATIHLTEGKVYTYTNPFLWGNCRSLRIEGNRAKLMNFRSGTLVGFDANWGAFRVPAPMMVNGVEVLTFGAGQGNGTPIMGATVATVEPGATTLTILAGTLEAGEAWLYAHDRYGEGGAPTTPSYLEPVFITQVVGATATLLQPAIHRYSQLTPELTVGGTPQAGAARCVMLNRNTDGDYRKSIWMDRLEVFDVEFFANPLQTAVVTNGLAGFSGAKSIHVEGCKGTNAYISQAESFKMVNSVWAGQFEIDKMVGDVTIHGGEIDELLAAVGCKSLSLDKKLQIHKILNVAPMELMHHGDYTLRAKNNPGDAQLINDYAFGSFKTIIDGPTIIVDNPTADRLLNVNKFNWTPTTITATTLTSTRAAWDASQWKQAIRVGSTIYAGSVAVGEVTVMPEVPSGPLLTGDVQVGYKLYGGAIAPATVLSLLAINDLEIRNPPKLEGPYARQIADWLGADIVAANSKVARIKSPAQTETQITLTQKMIEPYASGQTMKTFGRAFCMTKMTLRVTRAATDAGAVGMFIGGDKADGTGVTLISSLDLKTLGERELAYSSSSGLRGLGLDSLGGTVAITIATPGVVTLNSHGLSANQTVQFRTTGALPTGLTALTTYYVRNPTANTFEVSATSGGASIATSGAQSGVHTIHGLPIDPMVSLRIFDNSTPDVTVTIATPGVFTRTAHGMANNTAFRLLTGGALPTGLSAGVTYYARNVTANTFEASLTSGGASIATTGTQSGTHALADGDRAAWTILIDGYYA